MSVPRKPFCRRHPEQVDTCLAKSNMGRSSSKKAKCQFKHSPNANVRPTTSGEKKAGGNDRSNPFDALHSIAEETEPSEAPAEASSNSQDSSSNAESSAAKDAASAQVLAEASSNSQNDSANMAKDGSKEAEVDDVPTQVSSNFQNGPMNMTDGDIEDAKVDEALEQAASDGDEKFVRVPSSIAEDAKPSDMAEEGKDLQRKDQETNEHGEPCGLYNVDAAEVQALRDGAFDNSSQDTHGFEKLDVNAEFHDQRVYSNGPRSEVTRSKLLTKSFDVGETVRTVKSWREPNPEVQLARDRARTQNTSGDVSTAGTGRWSNQASGFRNLRGTSHADQVPGKLVWRWDERAVAGRNTVTVRWEYFETADGRPMERKGRYFLIVGVQDQIVKECPIYSNDNTGLLRTPEERKREYMSIRPRHVEAKDFFNQSPGNEVLMLEWVKERLSGNMVVRETMVVHWTDVRERDIDDSDVRIFGRLAEVSTKTLLEKVEIGR